MFSALVLVSGSSFAEVSPSCQQYFKDLDSLIEQASKENGQNNQQFIAMKPQLDESKKQLESLSVADQEAGCKQALSGLAQLKQGLGLK